MKLTLEDQAEVARFIDTGKHITHKGRTYAVLNPPPDETRADSRWILRSSKGHYYALMRNVPNPKVLFAVSLYGARMSCNLGWFTDASGELASCTP
jgi:hypothetical protein